MGMFDYKNYSSEEAALLVDDISRLSGYTNSFKLLSLIPGVDGLNLLGDITGELFPNATEVGIPQGWEELTPRDFAVNDDLVDDSGYFSIPSLYTGTAVEGPQAKIFGQYNDTGDLVRINLDLAGTNGIADVLDYLNLNSREGVELFEPILTMVKEYALENGLQGSDVVISGYSLGAGLTNVLAAERENLVDGFFTDSDYMAFAVPTIYDNGDVVLNVGYENDVVHRAAGDSPDFLSAVLAADFGLVNPDVNYASSVDNLVLFNDVYASPIWDVSVFSLLNIPTGWYAHINGITTDAITRIAESSFYEDTTQDSTVIVADLTAVNRAFTWVEDDAAHTSSHFGSSAFLVGGVYDDLIKGGTNFDYIDAGMGNDTIRAGVGVDHIDGNAGIDELRVEGRNGDWDVYRMEDDTLFFVDVNKGGINLVEAENIESISFSKEINSHINNYEITDTGLNDNRFLLELFDLGDKVFADHVEGTDGADSLDGRTVFAREGDDTVTGTILSDTLHAGRGNDLIIGRAGNDRLFGAEGDDRLEGGLGHDILVGGIGSDTFVIDILSGNDVIADFNNDAGYTDTIEFSSAVLSDMSDVIAHTTQVGDDVSVSLGSLYSLTIENALVLDVLNCAVVV